MTHSPLSGFPYLGMAAPTAGPYRTDNPTKIWEFNPWTGERRKSFDIERDPYGHTLVPPGEKPRPTRRASDITMAMKTLSAGFPSMNLMHQPSKEELERIAANSVRPDPGLERWYAETLARRLIDPEAYADEVSAKVRNHARRVLGITYQEPE